MKAVTINAYEEAPQLTDVPEPKVGPDGVLVRIRAAGVNPVDWKIAAGYLDPVLQVNFPLILGWDLAGVVERTGPAVTEFAPGDEVVGYNRQDVAQFGTYAEQVAAPVRTLARKPASLSWEQAAGLPLAGLTALQSLRAADTGSGDTVLVHAAAGGVGSLAAQIAVALGARVIGTASERNHDYLRSLGAEPVAYGDGLVERVRELAPGGVDAAFDFVGGDALPASFDLVKEASRVVSVVDTAVSGSGGRYVFVRPDSAGLAELGALADAGKLTVHVDRELPLAEAAEAHRLSQEGRTRGKIVLTVPRNG
ncbi:MULTISPECIES: NADP-dependent oxidoreductase [Streptomyces]|uniref:NADP-dependent oxidoreductase n=1 Tax=Streptomyces lycii TaxID=2654337 RepID=A0ABQ7FHU3_9ACTN|nr:MULTISPECIES: NADP-dependent oxidoreductase [Streptomyces]KAF4407915.1 NADP-dependent oxidoreductase [Streptomyces lycii]PGH47805.1 alcohol dehydrogenase [Streptomyces sp. Ru87]